MRSSTHSRGTTLLEAMVAMVVMLIGALGLIGLHTSSLRLNADARHVMRAAAITQDLVDNIALWTYSDTRIANSQPGNDADFGDSAFAFEATADPLTANIADHGEGDLVGWTGLPASALQIDGTPFYERYWNVAYPDDLDGDGIFDGVRVAVIVRWPSAGGWRRIVSITGKLNPNEQW